MISTLPALLLLASLPLTSVPATPRPLRAGAEVPRSAPAEGVEVVYLANSGFLLRSSEITIVIDGFVRKSHKGYAALPEDLFGALVGGKEPFEGDILGLVSHNHRDHVQPRIGARFLAANPKAALAAAPDVIAGVLRAAKETPQIANQVFPLETDESGTDLFDLDPRDVRIHVLALGHSGDAEDEVENHGYLIEIGDVTVLHLGDADATRATFEGLGLEDRDIDAVFVPSWFFASAEGAQIIDQVLRARTIIACHIPPTDLAMVTERMKIDNPHVVVFQEPLESRRIEPRNDG